MFKHKVRLCCLLLIAVLLFGGCARRADMDDIRTLQAQIDELLLEHHALEQRLAALESDLPKPSAAPTVAASAEPDATPVPAQGYSMTADEICSQLLKDGMPVVSFLRRTEKDDPDQLLGTSSGYTSRADFRDQNTTDRGIVEVFDSSTYAALRESVIKNEIRFGQREKESVFRYDNVLLRLPASFTDEQALAYEEALRRVLGVAG